MEKFSQEIIDNINELSYNECITLPNNDTIECKKYNIYLRMNNGCDHCYFYNKYSERRECYGINCIGKDCYYKLIKNKK